LGWRVRPRDQRTLLLLSDLLVAYLALAAALYIWSLRDQWLPTFISERINANSWLYFLPLVWIVFLIEMYDPHRAKSRRQTILGIALAVLFSVIFYALLYLIAPKGSMPRWVVGIFLLLAGSLTLIWRMVYIRVFTNQAFLRRVLVVGAGKAGRTLAEVYNKMRPRPFTLVGYMDDDPLKKGRELEGYPILDCCKCLPQMVEQESISDVVIAISGEMSNETFQSILDTQESGVEMIPMPTLYEEMLGRVPIHHMESDWLVRSFVNEIRVNGF
jgi:FlaA1/EpsC-like NDP-sugar epimerase